MTATGGFPNPGKGDRLPGDDEFLNANQLANVLNLSRATIYRLLAAGRLPRGQRLNRCRRWSRREIEAWMAGGCAPAEKWEQEWNPKVVR
jgi:excisionase family DNA binding protein